MVEGGGDPYEWPLGGVVQARVPSDPDGAGPIPARQGPAGQEQVGRTPTARVGQLWLEGRGGGCSQDGGGRGPRGPAIGPGR